MATRGHLIGDSLEMGVLGHLMYSYVEPSIESREIVEFSLNIEDMLGFELEAGDVEDGNSLSIRAGLGFYNSAHDIDIDRWVCQQVKCLGNIQVKYLRTAIFAYDDGLPLICDVCSLKEDGTPDLTDVKGTVTITGSQIMNPLPLIGYFVIEFPVKFLLEGGKDYGVVFRTLHPNNSAFWYYFYQPNIYFNGYGVLRSYNMGASWTVSGSNTSKRCWLLEECPKNKFVGMELPILRENNTILEANFLDKVIRELTLDQSQMVNDNNFALTSNYAYAQQFIPSVTAQICSVKLMMRGYIDKRQLFVGIYLAGGDGKPTGDPLSYTVFNSSALPLNYLGWYEVQFTEPSFITAGTMYLIVIKKFVANSTFVAQIGRSVTDLYPLGICFRSSNNGLTWTTSYSTIDLCFQTFYDVQYIMKKSMEFTLEVDNKEEVMLEVF